MQNILKIAGIQTALVWENVEDNLLHFKTILATIPTDADLIVLPETFTTGFSMNTSLSSESHQKGFTFLKEMAQDKNAAIVGSIMIEENNQFFNRLYFVYPSGEYVFYDKKHLFSLVKENEYFAPGNKQVVADYKGWKIALQICYDLRFPVWNRRAENYAYDILLNVANWPERRSFAWKSLLTARAIENQAYVIGINRVGKDGNEIDFSGESIFLDPFGKSKASLLPFKSGILMADFSYEYLQKVRKSFPFAADADAFEFR